jgi:outer membrane protein TolC
MYTQSVLTLQDAISYALKENFGIQISELEQASDAMQVYKANAGIGPTIDWNVNFSTTGNNVNQNFIDGRTLNRWGRAFNPNTNVSIGLVLYDGGRMNATFERLGKLSQYSTLQGKIIIQNTIVNVMSTYYELIRQKNTVDYLNTLIAYYDERLKITEERWKVGQGSKLDFLQSKTDLNAQLSELTRAENNLKNGKVMLNGILNRDPSESFDIEDIENIRTSYDFNELQKQAKENNRDLVLLQKAIEISMVQEKEVEALKAPQISLNGSAGYAYSNSNAGFLASNRNVFATVGFTASLNLYDGNHRKNQVAIAKLNTRIAEKQRESLENQVINDLNLIYNQYLSDVEMLAFEEENKTIAEENLSISIEKFRLGGSSILELNEAQRAYDTALNRLVNAEYNMKISELNLLRLSGSLVE